MFFKSSGYGLLTFIQADIKPEHLLHCTVTQTLARGEFNLKRKNNHFGKLRIKIWIHCKPVAEALWLFCSFF